jgi:hypothetical protein
MKIETLSSEPVTANSVNTVLTAGNFKPILFSTPMVQAILRGEKTQTRRLIKEDKLIFENFYIKNNTDFEHVNGTEWRMIPGIGAMTPSFNCKFKIGDILWVRETWQHTKCLNINFEDENYGYVYKADSQPWEDYEHWTWKPSIFMPKEVMNLQIALNPLCFMTAC